MLDANISAYIVPSSDAHNSEYTSERDLRRAWISDFTGSAGTAVVTTSEALLWTDGRYFLQADDELSDEWTLMKDRIRGTPSIEAYLAKNLSQGEAVGYDPLYFSIAQLRAYQEALGKAGVRLRPISNNLVDVLWGSDQPTVSKGKICHHSLKYAGQSSASKLAQLRKDTLALGASCALVTSLDDIAWLLNIRGSDVPMCPVTLAYVLVADKACWMFVDRSSKIDDATEALIRKDAGDGLTFLPYSVEAVRDVMLHLRSEVVDDRFAIVVDAISCNCALSDTIDEVGASAICRPSLIAPRKARKNEAELEGLRRAHVRDGAAVVRFLSWLESRLVDCGDDDGSSSTKERATNDETSLTECIVADRLEAFRKEMSPDEFVGLSFETIAGSGSNGAIIHYSPKRGQDATVTRDKMFLCDSGAQYVDGTTDVTRTVHFGTPTAHEIECFTRVLQGHIDLATAVFPAGTSGYQLDLLARSWLWRAGLDYNHGTGHGVGAYLNVHEGPHGISSYVRSDAVKFEEGFTITNEPGYYEDGNFGIRHENVLVVVKAKTDHSFGGKEFLAMESITFVPFQRNCIDKSLLTQPQIDWIDAYHVACRTALAPLLRKADDARALGFLARETAPL